MDPRHIARSTEQFEPVHMGDLALAGDDVAGQAVGLPEVGVPRTDHAPDVLPVAFVVEELDDLLGHGTAAVADRKSTRLNSSHVAISYAVFCLKEKIASGGWLV